MLERIRENSVELEKKLRKPERNGENSRKLEKTQETEENLRKLRSPDSFVCASFFPLAAAAAGADISSKKLVFACSFL